MIKRSTWSVLIIFMFLIAAYFWIRHTSSNDSANSTSTPSIDKFLITEADGTLQSIRITDDHFNSVAVQRDPNGTWMVTLPEPRVADLSTMGATETQVGALRIVAKLDDQLNLKEAGLEYQIYSIELSFTNGIEHSVQIGTKTPTNSGYYVRFDNESLYVISQSGIDSLLNLLNAPPYSGTATPSPTEFNAMIPTLDAMTTTTP
jgi:hypothetical protein